MLIPLEQGRTRLLTLNVACVVEAAHSKRIEKLLDVVMTRNAVVALGVVGADFAIDRRAV